MKNKREIILDAMQKIMTDSNSTNTTVSEVARQAGIAKGGVYYYFNSKDEIVEAVIERAYSEVIEESRKMISNAEMTTMDKLKAIFDLSVHPSEDEMQSTLLRLLNVQDNVIIHQKFIVMATKKMSPILTEVIKQGIEEGILECDYPEQYAQFILSMLVLSLDSVLLPTDGDERLEKLRALASLLEAGLKLKKGSFSYWYSRMYK